MSRKINIQDLKFGKITVEESNCTWEFAFDDADRGIEEKS